MTDPGWVPPVYAGGPPPAPRENSPKAVAAVIAAGLSYACCPGPPALVALVLAAQARREIDASGGRYGGDTMVAAARYLSWVNLAGCALFVLVLLAALAGRS